MFYGTKRRVWIVLRWRLPPRLLPLAKTISRALGCYCDDDDVERDEMLGEAILMALLEPECTRFQVQLHRSLSQLVPQVIIMDLDPNKALVRQIQPPRQDDTNGGRLVRSPLQLVQGLLNLLNISKLQTLFGDEHTLTTTT